MTIIRQEPAGLGRHVATRPALLLALAGLLYAAAQLLLVSPRIGIGWDEAVYASQYASHAPPAIFSAPRAQGVALLVAPVVAVTDSVPLLRLFLTAISALALCAAFAPWLRVRDGYTVPLAALLFAGTWLTLFYGNEAMPNLYVALSAVAATGLLVRPSRWPALGLATAFAVMSLMRPSDALVAAAVLGAAALAVPAWRRIASLAGIAAGLAVGWGQWLIEAELRFGGVAARLGDAAEHNVMGWTASVIEHARALDGPSLCRFGTNCGPVSPVALLWWLAIPVMAAAGVWAARRTGRFAPLLLAAGTGAALALPYLFYVDYAAPRFLMPAYALLSLPVAEAVTALLGLRRPLATVFGVGGVLAHLALQGGYAHGMSGNALSGRERVEEVAAELRQRGVRPPCLVYGESGVQLGYLLGCSSRGVIQRFGEREPAQLRTAMARGDQVVVVHTDVPPPPYVAAWRKDDLPGGWSAYHAPAAE
ncbi:hypothetical protein ITP53_52385 [Nonomuraea sp. K274]|uniref:Dolichyl-phosphate-mannose-protein mannosyltransferase n=1 Tax=Nonomuraea cypriaca TaxID=1187855 RepID=A0A931AP22_9ACTN|nr:hypothetical protein [Nonomuraea cypriaca]MBF8194133.1 hypothetical protein [Nonomuraea cypriaca]